MVLVSRKSLISLPSPDSRYNQENEAQFRRGLEMMLQDVASEAANNFETALIVVVAQDATEISGERILLFSALDAEEDASGDPKVILRITHNVGNVSGNTALDYANGGTQKMTMTADTTITGISNFPDGSWMNLRVVTGGFTLTFSSSAFEGPLLQFTDATVWLSIVDFNEAKVAVMGGGV